MIVHELVLPLFSANRFGCRNPGRLAEARIGGLQGSLERFRGRSKQAPNGERLFGLRRTHKILAAEEGEMPPGGVEQEPLTG